MSFRGFIAFISGGGHATMSSRWSSELVTSKLPSGILAVAVTHSQDTHHYVPISLLAVGILLIIASWTSIGKVAADAAWTPQDAEVYGRLVQENHSLSYQSAEHSGLTEEEFAANRKNVEDKLEAMIDKLEHAISRPEIWSRNLFWTGTVLAVLGALAHLSCRAKSSSA